MAVSVPAFELQSNDIADIRTVPCDYCSPGELERIFNNNTTNITKKTFSIFTLNIRSCRKNFNMLLSFIQTYLLTFSFIVLVETWLSNQCDHIFNIPGYKQLNVYRNNHGGGIKVLYKETFSVKILDDMTFVNNVFESLTFSCSVGSIKYLINCIYRPPSSSVNSFNDMYHELILDKLPNPCNFLVTGDVNINLYNPFKLRPVNEFINIMLSFGLFPIINKPTIFHESNPITKYALLDHVWVNFNHGSNHMSGIVEFAISDHLPVFYMFSHNIFSRSFKRIKYKFFSNDLINNFITQVNNLDFSNLYDFENVDDAFSVFYTTLYDVYNTVFPTKTKKIKHNLLNQPWVTPKLRRCIKKKYHLYNLMKRGIINRRSFIVYKNLLNYVINKLKSKYYSNKFNSLNGDSKKIWNNVNDLLARKNKDSSIEIKENGIIIGGRSVASVFNRYFTTVVSDLVKHFPTSSNSFSSDYINRVSSSCFLYPTNVTEILFVLMKMKKKGNCLYDIPPKYLLVIKDKILPFLEYFYNRCIIDGVYPSILKVARVVPIHKSGDKQSVDNFRPISNLSSLNKIFETLTFHRLSTFIKKNNLISENQFGFVKDSSTTLAIFTLLNDFMKAFKFKTYICALFLDLRKAFDVVDREILLKKLNLYGIRGIVNNFIRSYLSDRSQFVAVNCFESEQLPLRYGVPQGSVLGPTLFNLFINDIANIPGAKTILFADDTVFYIEDNCFNSLIIKVNEFILRLEKWLESNRIVANISKTKLMLITPKQITTLPDIFFNGYKVGWVTSITYLGLIIDNKLNFNLHFENICTNLNRYQGLIYLLSTLLPRDILMKIYYGMVYPTLTQNIVIWGSLGCERQRRISVLLNKIVRHISNIRQIYPNVVSTSTLYKNLSLLKYNDIYKFFLLKFTHFLLYKRNEIFINIFSNYLPSSNYNTRNSDRINLPNVRTEIEKNFTVFKICELMRELPDDLLLPQHSNTLKNKFKKQILLSY